MIKPPVWPVEDQSWDQYRAFHVAVAASGFYSTSRYNGLSLPLVLFDTGELICTAYKPDRDHRHRYRSLNVELTISEDMTGWWTPCGIEIASGKVWLDDGGSQYFLVDHDMGEAVRLDHRGYRPGGRKPPRPGVPARFQDYPGYIPGPGCSPVGMGSIVVRPTFKAYFDRHPGLKERISELVTQAKSIATVCRERYVNHSPVPFERLMSVECATQLDADERARLLQFGFDRPKLLHNRLLAAAPR